MANRKMILEPCLRCGKVKEYPANEHQRKERLGTRFFCSPTCASAHTNKVRWTIDGLSMKESSTIRRLVLNTKKNRKRRNRAKEIDDNLLDLVVGLWKTQKGVCALSGVPLVTEKGPQCISIDRIDSHVGYVDGNIQLVCLGINYMKHTFSNHITTEFLKKVKECAK